MIALSRLQQHSEGLFKRVTEALFLKVCGVVNEGLLEVTLPNGDHHVFGLHKGGSRHVPGPPGGLGIGRYFRPDELEAIPPPW